MPLLNYTTSVPVSRTIAQVQAKLVEHGAREVMMSYSPMGRVEAISFSVPRGDGVLPIRLPVDVPAAQQVLMRQRDNGEGVSLKQTSLDHAYRVAWRIVKDWVEAQMALLETEMVRMEQIFLPYVVTNSGATVFQVMEQKNFLLGPAPGPST